MARRLFILAMILLAGSIGVLGYQFFDYLIDGSWPAVPVHFIVASLFGDMPDVHWMSINHVLSWLGEVPVSVAGMILAYMTFLLSDTLRRG
jgi:hypothetical protein